MTTNGKRRAGGPRLSYDDPTHSYRLGERSLRSVTGELNGAGLYTEYARGEVALARGRAVHLACRFLDEGDLDWATVPDDQVGYVRAWDDAKKVLRMEFTAIEVPVYNVKAGLAGTPDRVGKVRARWRSRRAIVDLKSGEVQPVAALQTAGYAYLVDRRAWFNRYAVALRADGSFRIVEYGHESYLSDLQDFFAALRVAEWRRRNIA